MCGKRIFVVLIRSISLALLMYLAFSRPGNSAPFPSDANVLDVTHFGAKGDGITDDTHAIHQAIKQIPPFDVRHPWQTKILYFPDGTYLITDTIQRRDDMGRYLPGLVIIGQSQKSTVIKLADNSSGYQNSAVGKAMIFMASGLLAGDPRAGGKDPTLGEGNDAYVNTLENLTLEVGRGNEGAIGLDYLANNIGAVRDVTIRTSDRGRVGLSMTRKWIGPALIQRVSIIGFDVGIDVSHTEYSVTLDEIVIRKSRKFGLRNDSNSVPFHNITIEADAGIGIANIGQQALITGIDAMISGKGEAAFRNSGFANLQKVSVSGFYENGKLADPNNVNGVFEGERRKADSSWSLPIASMAFPDVQSSRDWINVRSFGAVADPNVDSTSAILAAFRSGAGTIYFPTGQYKISGPILVPRNVEKIEGLFSTIFADRGPQTVLSQYPVFLIEPRSNPLAMRRLIVEGREGSYAVVDHRASSPILLQDIVSSAIGFLRRPAEGGSVFAENVSGGRMKLAGPAGVWLRQLNVEAVGTMIENDGAPLWILGVKTEQTLTLIEGRNQANTELVGGLIYRVTRAAQGLPLFSVFESRLLASYAEEAFFPDAVYEVHALARFKDRDVLVLANDLPLRGKYARMAPQLVLQK